MPEPTSGFTFEDLIIRVAEYLGVSSYGSTFDGAAAIPTDAHDLALCKRLVNDGIRMFINSNPKWYWTRRLYSLTITTAGNSPLQINSDPGRYIMPQDFNGDTMGRWTYGDDEDTFPSIETVPEYMIREWRSVGNNTAGDPQYAAFRRLPDADVPEGQRARWEVIFYPDPGETIIVTLPYRHYFNELVGLSEGQPAGIEFDEAVEAATLAKAELDRDDTRGARWEYWSECLAKAMEVDRLAAPRTVGKNLDRSNLQGHVYNRRDLGYERPVRRVTYNP